MNSHVGFAGRFRLIVKRRGKVIEQTPWFANLVTDDGLDYAGERFIFPNSRCTVGSGTTTPAVTDTTLENFVAAQQSASQVSKTRDSSTRWMWVSRITNHQFAIGAVVGTIAEVGIGLDDPLFSRSLIKDEAGNPTTLTLTAADQLFVLYDHRLYVDADPVALAFSANGEAQTGTARPIAFNSWDLYTATPGRFQVMSGDYAYVGATALGAVTATDPVGYTQRFNEVIGSSVKDSYVTGSRERVFRLYMQGSGTINAFRTQWWGGGSSQYRMYWQYLFAPGVAKTADQTLELAVKVTWGRYEA